MVQFVHSGNLKIHHLYYKELQLEGKLEEPGQECLSPRETRKSSRDPERKDENCALPERQKK
jgi:hypothetical protein